MLERTTLALSENEKQLYEHFKTLNPGQFRKVLKSAEWITADQETKICTENGKADNLYFLFDGNALIKRQSNSFEIPDGCFLGEIAFITDGPYTADVFAKEQTTYVKMDIAGLKKIMSKDQELQNAMISLFNFDMAKKLAVSNR